MDVMDDRQARLSHIRAFILWNTDQSLSLNLFLSLSFSLVPSLRTRTMSLCLPQNVSCGDENELLITVMYVMWDGVFPGENINIRTGKSKLMESLDQKFRINISSCRTAGHRSLKRTSPSAMGRGWDMGMRWKRK